MVWTQQFLLELGSVSLGIRLNYRLYRFRCRYGCKINSVIAICPMYIEPFAFLTQHATKKETNTELIAGEIHDF